MGFEAATPVSSFNSSRVFDLGHCDGPRLRDDIKVHQITKPLSVGLCASWKDCHAGAPVGLQFFDLLKPTGHVMHQRFNIQQLYTLPTLYLCVLYLSESKQQLVPLTA